MKTENIVVVLDHPDESRNIGAACRAMANNGVKILRIVGERENYDEERIRILAIHAFPIYEKVEFFSSITEATKDCAISAGTTRRRGKKRKEKLFLPEEFASHVSPVSENAKIAVVFGNERTGLTDEQFSECTVGVTIPSCPDFASLNLSHAVQIILYALFREISQNLTGFTPITLDRIDISVNNICNNLQKIGFFHVTGRDDMERFWRSLLARSAMSESEAQYIEKVFSKAAGLIQSKSAEESKNI